MTDQAELPGTEGQEQRKVLVVNATTMAAAQCIAAEMVKVATIFAPPGVSIEDALVPVEILVTAAVRNQLRSLERLAMITGMEDVVRDLPDEPAGDEPEGDLP